MDLQAQSLGTVLELANRVLAILQALLGSVGSLALLVATLGVANTMMMAIYERTREIGVLKALGATSAEVRRMFTADAVLLGIIGGFVGIILGTLLGRLVDWAGHLYLSIRRDHGSRPDVHRSALAGDRRSCLCGSHRRSRWPLPGRPGRTPRSSRGPKT